MNLLKKIDNISFRELSKISERTLFEHHSKEGFTLMWWYTFIVALDLIFKVPPNVIWIHLTIKVRVYLFYTIA